MSKIKWTKELILEEAKKYHTRNTWNKGNHSSVKAARRLGIHKLACEHMDIADWDKRYQVCNDASGEKVGSVCKYTDEYLLFTALKYYTRWDFQLNSRSEYQIAKRHGKLDSICKHMKHLDIKGIATIVYTYGKQLARCTIVVKCTKYG